MRITTIFIVLIALSLNYLSANNTLPLEKEPANSIVNVRLNMPITATEGIETEVFTFDVVGLESDATAHYLTNGVTNDLHNLITELKLDRSYVKIGIKLTSDKNARYFLFDRTELTYGQIDWNEGKE